MKYFIYDKSINLQLELSIHELISYIKKNPSNDIYKKLSDQLLKINNELAIKTVFICHRINTTEQLKTIDNMFGVEIDLRDSKDSKNGNLILEHDPFKSGEDFSSYLKNYNHQILILNIKSERIEYESLKLININNITNYFFLDSTLPMIYTINKNYKNNNFACRISELEPIENLKSIHDYINWVWLDCFTKLPIDKEIYELIKSYNKKICIVSPELHNQQEKIDEYKEQLKNLNIIPDAICCKIYNIINWL